MKLAEWLSARKMTQDAFGLLIGVTQGRVSQIATGGTSDLRIALKIEDATGGEVTTKEVLPPPAEQAEAS